jgi:acyl dehydratase
MTRATQTSIVRNFSQADFDHFALLSGDDNPIHTDPVFCVGTRFGRTVAHGLLLCSVLRGLIEKLLPGGRLSEQSMMFPAPTYAGEPMFFSVAVIGEGKSVATDPPDLASPDLACLEIEMQIKRVEDEVVTCQGRGMVVI